MQKPKSNPKAMNKGFSLLEQGGMIAQMNAEKEVMAQILKKESTKKLGPLKNETKAQM